MVQEISRKEILVELDNVLSSPQISGSGVLSEFLKFIVHETLEGRGEDLKEYTIGVNALKRDSSFNPQIDSIVRIHAGRLRRSLKEYYYEAGANDEVVITIPKGSYQPVFEQRSARHAREAGRPVAEFDHLTQTRNPALSDDTNELWHRITLAVLPFRQIGLDKALIDFTNSIGEYLSTEFTSFNDLRVVSYYHGSFAASQPTDLLNLGRTLKARYLLTGSVQMVKPLIRVLVQLSDSTTGDQLWAHSFEKQYTESDLGTFQQEIVDRTIGGVTGVNGSISRNEIRGSSDKSTEVSLSYWYGRYSNSFDENTMAMALAYYEEKLKKDPRNAQVLGFMGEILAGKSMMPSSKDKSLDRAIECSRMAIKVDPKCQQGYQALAICLLLQRKKEECIQILNQGIAVNPKSTDFLGGMGAVLIFAGDFESGARLVRRAMELTPNLPWWQIFSLSFYSYVNKKYHDAIFLTTKMQIDIIWIPVIKAASFAQLGQMDEARVVMNQVKNIFPGIDLLAPGTLNQLFYSDVMVKEISGGLKKIGS
jgi:TolB-like protein